MISRKLRAYLIAGLVVWLPVLMTFGVIGFIVDILDTTVALLPSHYQPEALFGHKIPGLGVVLSLALLLITGLLATNILGERLVGWGEALLTRIPLVRSIYNAAKQVIQAIFSTNSQAFRKVVMVEYPRAGIWSVGFITGQGHEEMHQHSDEVLVTVFIPTTPVPTSGYIVMLPEREVKPLSMSVDEALKFIISLGVMSRPVSSIELNDNKKKVFE